MECIHHHFKLLDSTNNWAKLHACEFHRDQLTLVTADEQSGGRGRFKRRWESPADLNIYATFCFFVEKHRRDIGNIPQLMALSAAESLEAFDFQPTLKWPNDILLSKKKVGGILAETTPFSEQICVIIGIGLNINMPISLLEKIDRPATSLSAERGHNFDVQIVLSVLQKTFSQHLSKFLNEGFPPFFNAFQTYLKSSMNTRVRFDDNRQIWEGELHSINPDGSLNLQLDNGSLKTFHCGEILF